MAGGAQRPLIGISGPRRGALGPRLCAQAGVRIAGARAVQLAPGDDTMNRGLDGLVISGGHDIDPVLYKSVAEVRGNYDPERDAFERAAIEYALARELPVLGICRGAQLLNVVLGGSLHQDLSKRRVRTSKRRTLLPLKTLCLDAGSALARLLGIDTLKINSLHNQAIDRVGRGLQIAGRDLDAIVQAIEAPSATFVVGVQWHPEFLLYAARQRRLFHALVAAAR